MNDNNIIIIENDNKRLGKMLEVLAGRNLRGTAVKDLKSALKYIDKPGVKMIIVCDDFADKTVPGCFKKRQPEIPVVLVSENDDAESAVRAISRGFSDFVTSPINKERLVEVFSRYCPNHKTKYIDGQSVAASAIAGASSALKETVRVARQVAGVSAPVLITGPSGTGKELIAELIHNRSPRRNNPFVKVNCAALSDTLMESELFGHEKGAFTGALTSHKGRFERADGGTLLLDEITETSPRFQAQLLRVLEEMDFERVGGNENINVNVRIISTTNKNITHQVRENGFRADLYYRLAGVRVDVPALKDRPEDIEPLVWHFINMFAYESGRKITKLDTVTKELFENFEWPGNVRQLRNVVRTAMILGKGEVLSIENASWLAEDFDCSNGQIVTDELIRLAGINLDQLERQAILATLQQNKGNQSKSARQLGISDRTLRDKIKKYKEQDCSQPAGMLR